VINYKYTEENLLDNPHNYMYASFQGEEFVNAYYKNRLNYIKLFELKANQIYINTDLFLCQRSIEYLKTFLENSGEYQKYQSIFDDLTQYEEIILNYEQDFINNIQSFDLKNEIDTESLLISILYSQLNNRYDKSINQWLDRLIQRFEVTKKLYEVYLSGFRNGKGSHSNLRIYWMLSLSLNLRYVETQNIKYLSTLMKVSDLICSVEQNTNFNHQIPKQGLILILLVEIITVRLLTNSIEGFKFVFK
jgi:hypothetical protein